MTVADVRPPTETGKESEWVPLSSVFQPELDSAGVLFSVSKINKSWKNL